MQRIDWYFDFVSPFAYFQLVSLRRAETPLEIACHPVLFAGLLRHWEMKGPAEIPEKRRFTYRYVQWYAQREGIAFRMPPAHPFNPLSALRLVIALDCDIEAIQTVFEFIWAQ